ncbi:arylesterase [Clostridium tyrobutyricum]|nr:GDSL-type esterase/lipase family protein [Clostridium tyrobutyricum]ANP69185.1 arylesterase [Clostridium tyrobutyricum]MBR9648977.1 arylesterase [Clostridium tyrobutyricum]MBV4415563.1 arylesterase [Clostridium tyrobutyricum]MBV4421356.1 arylesterase [Clostridium tyrobutyricum]MBV4425036.1 arylesterase [Clostridium tyrobutyricum]
MPMKLICIGDSITYGYGVNRSQVWTKLMEIKLNVEVINKGVSGDTTGGMLSRIYYDVILNNPTHAIIMGGTNDLIWNVNIHQIEANLAAMAFQIMQNNIIPVFALSIPICENIVQKKWGFIGRFDNINSDIIKLNQWIRTFSENYNINVINFYPLFYMDDGNIDEKYYIDGLHLNRYGHEKMAEIINLEDY